MRQARQAAGAVVKARGADWGDAHTRSDGDHVCRQHRAAGGERAEDPRGEATGGAGEHDPCPMYGHIPHGFYKDQMQGFFQELGAIKKRVSIVWNRKMKLVVHGDPRCTDRRYQRSRGKCKCVCVKNYCFNSRSVVRSFKRYVAYSNVCGDCILVP